MYISCLPGMYAMPFYTYTYEINTRIWFYRFSKCVQFLSHGISCVRLKIKLVQWVKMVNESLYQPEMCALASIFLFVVVGEEENNNKKSVVLPVAEKKSEREREK